MARAAALALLDQSPTPLFALHKELKDFDQVEVDAALLQLEQDKLVSFSLVPVRGEKVKVLYRSGKAESDSKDSSPSTLSPPVSAATKSISPALQERLDRKRALMTPPKITQGDAKRKQPSPLEQEEMRLMTTIKLRKSQIEDLKRKKSLAEKSANPGELERLHTLSVKWGNVSRDIVRSLQPQARGTTLGELLKGLQIPPEMLGYSAIDDDFTLDFKSLDKINRDEVESVKQAEND